MTRPRPSVGPGLAGAVDLSGLKQRAQQKAAPGPGAGAAPRDPSGGGPGAQPIIQVTEDNFEDQVVNRSDEVLVVVLLWSPRSEACVDLLETLSALADEDNGKWALAAANVDAAPGIARAFGVQAVPTVVALAAGRPMSNFEGPQPADQLRVWLDKLLDATDGKLRGGAGPGEPEQVDPVLAQARQELEAGDFPAAKESYQAILDGDPGSVEAKAAVRQIDFLTRATAQEPDAVAVADAAPDDIDAAFAAADVEILGQDAAAAFDRLIALVRRKFGDDRTAVRTRLIELFELFDPADPEVVAGRRGLANALY